MIDYICAASERLGVTCLLVSSVSFIFRVDYGLDAQLLRYFRSPVSRCVTDEDDIIYIIMGELLIRPSERQFRIIGGHYYD